MLLGAAVLMLVLPLRTGPGSGSGIHPVPPFSPHALAPRRPEFGAEPASDEVRRLAAWIVASSDNGRRWFVILDKRLARIYLFQPDGRLQGASTVLLGSAPGDDSVVGIGTRPIADVLPAERTTPAGRFVARPGRNALAEDVVWVDYDAAVSMHKVRLTNPAEHRLQRLASQRVQDKRISYGCINLPPAFFESQVWPHFRNEGGIVYVLPEIKSPEAVFPGLSALAAAGPIPTAMKG
ncbi:MAG: hypothetical protein KGL43_21185 [Burkholderiales bacterium]|nr:hypothetical protein [Burkholderiales bacterium]